MSSDAIRNMLLTAKMQVRLASALYGGGEGLNALAGKVGAMPLYFESANVCAGALVFSDHLHLSICGTNDDYDWAINRNRSFTKFELLEVHAGYYDASRWIAKTLIDKSFFDFCVGRRLYVGGHSAGGALAQLVAMRTRHMKPPSQIYTFGSPKWCSRLTATLTTAWPWEVYRFAMSGDPVPYLPLNSWRQLLGKPGFAHTHPGMEVTEAGDVRSVDGTTTLFRLAAMARKAWHGGLFTSLASIGRLRNCIEANHSVERYKNAIYAAVEAR